MLSVSCLKPTCTLRHTHLSLNHPLAFYVVLDLLDPGYCNWLTFLALRLSMIKAQLEIELETKVEEAIT